MLLKSFFLFMTFVFSFSSLVLAEEAPTFNLGEIILTNDDEALFGISSTAEVTSRDIEVKNAQAVDETLDFIPGVRVTVGQKNEPYVMIRGFNQDDLLILLDGIPIASPYYGYVDLNQIPVDSISKIKVIKGSASTLYGANAMGGVINIVTKKPGEKPYLELNNSFSDRSTRHHALNYGAKFKDVNIWISGSHKESDGFELSKGFGSKRNENGGLRENSYYEKDALSLKLGLEKYDKHDLTVLFNYIDNEKGIPTHTSSNNPRYWRFTEWKRYMVALADESKLTDNLSIKGRVFYDKYDNTINAYDDATYTTQSNASSWTSIYDEYSLGSSIYFFLDPNDVHSLRGAVNFKKDVHKEQDDTGEPWKAYEIRTYSFGLEDEVRVGERLSLLIGANFDLFNQIKTYTGQRGGSVNSLNPLFSADYLLLPATSLYWSVSKKTRFPTINQLYANTSGNPDLKEQRNTNYEVGIKHNFEGMAKFSISWFYNNVKDLIDRANRNDLYLNTSKAIFEGVEADMNAKIGERFLSRLSYTYLDARDKNPELFGRSENELSYVPDHKVDLELRYITDFGLSCNVLNSYHGERYYYDSSNIQHALGGYSVWNGKVSQKFFDNWEGSIFIENLFDRNYQEEDGYPQPGRTFLLSVKGNF